MVNDHGMGGTVVNDHGRGGGTVVKEKKSKINASAKSWTGRGGGKFSPVPQYARDLLYTIFSIF